MENLVAFLYILVRDQVPPGVIEGIIKNHVEPYSINRRSYSSTTLEALARDFAMRILS